jgi:hypothetical protein
VTLFLNPSADAVATRVLDAVGRVNRVAVIPLIARERQIQKFGRTKDMRDRAGAQRLLVSHLCRFIPARPRGDTRIGRAASMKNSAAAGVIAHAPKHEPEESEGEHELLSFLTTNANAFVATNPPRALLTISQREL